MAAAATPAAHCQAEAERLPSTTGKRPRPCCCGSKDAHQGESEEKVQTLGKYDSETPQTVFALSLCYVCRFGVEVHDFGRSWRSGLAFLAMIKSIRPSLVDLRESLSREPRENIQLAFMVARHSLDIPPLLEPDGKRAERSSRWSDFIHRDKAFSSHFHCLSNTMLILGSHNVERYQGAIGKNLSRCSAVTFSNIRPC